MPLERKVILLELRARYVRANLCVLNPSQEEGALESGSQLSDASIKAPTKILLNGFSKESTRTTFGALSIVMDRRYIFHIGCRLLTRLTTVFVRLRYFQVENFT